MPVVLFFLFARILIHHDEIDEQFVFESLVDLATAPSGGGRVVAQVVVHELLSFADDEGMLPSLDHEFESGDLDLKQLPILQPRTLPSVRDDLPIPAETHDSRHLRRAQQHAAERAADEADKPQPRTLSGVRDDLPTPAETRDSRHLRRAKQHAAERAADEIAKPIHRQREAPFSNRKSVRRR